VQRWMWRRVLIFALVYFLMQWGWEQCRGTAIERTLVEDLTVPTSAWLINHFTPAVHSVDRGATISAVGVSINVRSGCEGTELLLPLIAALIAVPFSWSVRLTGIVGGTALVFVLNQIRLLALFYSLRSNPALFGQLHGFVGPLAFIMILVGFFALLLNHEQRLHLPDGG
jgi:exosortase/archaeosortase family protein